MDRIREVLTDVMRDLKTRKNSKDDPQLLLKKVLSKKEFGHVKFRYLRQGILGITVDSSVWMYQLHLQKEELLTKLSRKSHPVKDVRFYIGETKQENRLGR